MIWRRTQILTLRFFAEEVTNLIESEAIFLTVRILRENNSFIDKYYSLTLLLQEMQIHLVCSRHQWIAVTAPGVPGIARSCWRFSSGTVDFFIAELGSTWKEGHRMMLVAIC